MPNVTVTRAVAQQTQGELRHQVDAATGLDAQTYNAFIHRWRQLAHSATHTLQVATMQL